MSEHPRVLGLDVGERRIGLAISDPQAVSAAGLETIIRHNLQADVDRIADIAKRHNVIEIIIGLPLNADGTEDEHSMAVMAFGKKLARATGLPIIYEDERLSSVSAIRTFTVPGEKAGHRKDVADMQAAAIILQKYLDREEPPPSA